MDFMFPFDCTINFPLILLDFVIEFANFSLCGCHLFPLNCTINFQMISLDFSKDFAIFAMGLQMDG